MNSAVIDQSRDWYDCVNLIDCSIPDSNVIRMQSTDFVYAFNMV